MKEHDYRAIMNELLLEIPKGKVTTYKALAHAMGIKGYRYVGQLLNRNPHPDEVPCYKVVNTDGRIGGFAFGNEDKIRRLKEDGIQVKNSEIVDFEKAFYSFVSF